MPCGLCSSNSPTNGEGRCCIQPPHQHDLERVQDLFVFGESIYSQVNSEDKLWLGDMASTRNRVLQDAIHQKSSQWGVIVGLPPSGWASLRVTNIAQP